MKNLILKSSFHEKLKMLLLAIGLIVTSITTQMWAYDISANTTVVWDAGNESWTTAQLYIYKSDYNTADNLTRIGTTTQFYKLYSNSWNGYAGLIFRKDANWSAQTTDITRSISGTILFTYTGSKNYGKLNWGVTTSAKKATSGTTLYFDNTTTQWTQPRFKYGTSSFNRYFDMVAVPGTANLWKYTLPNDVYYWKYMVSQDYGWTDYNTIEDTHCNNYTAYQTSNLSSATTLIPSTNGKPCTTETLSGYTRSVTISSPSNGSITVTYTDVDESSKTKTSGSFNVAQTCIITVTATPNTGYVLSSLSVGGAAFTSGNTYTVRANTTISATFAAETTHDVAVSYICTDTEAAVKAGGSFAVGETTASTFEAGTPNGYSFTRWVVGNGLTITSGSTTSNSISVKTKSTGTYTLKAEYTEVLTTSWYISGATGGGSPFSGLTTSGTAMTKKHGYSAIEKYYCTISVSTVASGSGYSFTPYNSSNSKKYGNASANITKANNSATVYSDNSTDLHFLPYVTGDYEFELDNTGANPVLTVTWPVYNQVRISAASPTDATNTGNFDLGAAVSNVRSVTRSLNAGTTYTFKVVYNSDWYGKNSGAFTRSTSTSSNSITTSTSGGDMTLTTDYAGDYTFKFNQSTKALSIDFPAAYKITFGKGSVDGTTGSFSAVDLDNSSSAVTSNSTWVKSGNRVKITAPSAKTGYELKGWYDNNSGTGDAITTNANCTISVTAATTVYACYRPKTSALSFDYQTSDPGYKTSGTISAASSATYDAAMPALSGNVPTAKDGYAFIGFYDGTGDGAKKYYNADKSAAVSKWDKNTTSGTTLYAHYQKAEITSIDLSAATIDPGNNLTVTANISPTPAGTTHVEWRLLHANDNPYGTQPSEFSTNGASKTFAVPSTSATYKVEATLRLGSTHGSGTVLDTKTQSFRVAGDHKVTMLYKCGDATIKTSETITGKPLDWTEVTAPTIVGYQFHHWILGDGISIKDGETAGDENTPGTNPINIKAIYDGTLTAVYTQKRMIYFYNTLNWSDVYVYFYKDGNYWVDAKGTGTDPTYHGGSHNVDHKGHMLPVAEGSKIYYFDAEGASIPAGYTNVAFTEKQQDNCWYFYDNNKVSRRGDYKSSMPMFVPLGDQPEVKKNSNTASYYCEGYWMNYPANTGYTLKIYDTWNANNVTGASREFMIPFSEDMIMPLKQEVEINFSGESWFLICRNDGKYLEGSHTFKQSDHGDKKITSTDNAGTASKMRLISDGSGIYTFTLSFYGDGGNPEAYDYYLNVDFPAALGDYRIIYKDNATWSNGAHGNNYDTWYHPSDIIGKNKSTSEAKDDIVSFFIAKNNAPAMKFQYISAINATTGAITWTDVTSGTINLNNFSSDITAAGVYNIYVSQPKNGGSISVDSIKPYTGNYYIRTDCAGNTKWDNYRAPDHMMNYSEYSFNQTQDPYSHYYAHWVQTNDKPNIKFCVANDYSSAISDTLTREAASGTWAQIGSFIDEHGNVQCNANVRFMWNMSTNKVSRAYIDGAQESGSTFLVLLSGDSKIKDETGTNVLTTITFQDNQNWIYEANIKAQTQAAIKLRSTWIKDDKNIVQYFKGTSSETEQLIGGNGTNWYDIRLLYDFKTNRLVAAYKPSGNIEDELKINADVMFIREHQGDIAQLTFTNGGKITEIKTAYAVLRFNKWTLNNKDKSTHTALVNPLSRFERDIFYVSFPFRVSMEEVFGFGTYGQHWIIEYYDGATRAAKGYWQESPPNWKFITNRKGKYFEPNQGYIIALDLDELKENSSIWDNGVENVELFFPSSGTLTSITSSSVTHELPAHLCEINWSEKSDGHGGTLGSEYDRRVKDSHWNVLSVPTYVNPAAPDFANTEWITEADETHVGPNFLYEWNSDDNSVSPVSGTGYSYHAMHAYLVQYCGNVTWTSSVSPTAAPRRNPNYRGSYEFRLELMQNDKAVDQTFVKLTDDEAVTTGFEFNYDMSKEMNKNKANIYTLIGTEEAAGNCLPLTDQTTVVPVGVKIVEDGEYTFSMPDGTESIGITLIDQSRNTRTNLALTDYAVYLEAGDHSERFVLEISPIEQIVTNVELINGENGDAALNGVSKKLIDGVLYIIKDGKVFDARGARIQ